VQRQALPGSADTDEVLDGDFPSGGGERVGPEPEDEGEGEGAGDGGGIGAEPEAADARAAMEAEPAQAMQFDDKPKKKGDAKKPAKKKPDPPKKTITQVEVDLGSQKLSLQWSDGSTSKAVNISSGKGKPDTKDDPCADPGADGSNCTPSGTFTPGIKGGSDYKNKKGDAMSWYVEMEGTGASGRGIGIHDSQPVTGKPASHGCVRVDAGTAKTINKNITSATKIVVTGKAPTKAWSKAKPKPPKKKK
jgi:lipoprotein-anchoring transpeptidase ErfK/SrfK